MDAFVDYVENHPKMAYFGHCKIFVSSHKFLSAIWSFWRKSYLLVWITAVIVPIHRADHIFTGHIDPVAYFIGLYDPVFDQPPYFILVEHIDPASCLFDGVKIRRTIVLIHSVFLSPYNASRSILALSSSFRIIFILYSVFRYISIFIYGKTYRKSNQFREK